MSASERCFLSGVLGRGAALAFAMVGCGAGAPLESGDVAGDYDGQTFEPLYGVALDAYDDVLETSFEIQLSAEPIDCENHIVVGPTNPVGLYLVVRMDAAEVGSHEGAYLEYESLAAESSKQLGGFGTVELTSVTDETVAGSLTFVIDEEGRPHASAHGSFEVSRCAP